MLEVDQEDQVVVEVIQAVQDLQILEAEVLLQLLEEVLEDQVDQV